jgi:hypothetical protein
MVLNILGLIGYINIMNGQFLNIDLNSAKKCAVGRRTNY